MPDPASAPPVIQVVEYFLGVFAAIFPMVNPFSTMALFLSLTSDMSAPKQRYQVLKASLIAAVIMLVVLYIGAIVLHFFGISIGALRVTGGLIAAYIGFGILFPNATPTPGIAPASKTDDSDLDFAFMPLAFPSLVGPGTMAVVIEHDNPRRRAAGHYAPTIVVRGGQSLHSAGRAGDLAGAADFHQAPARAGTRGLDAMTRIMGLLLMCIGVQFVATGIRNFVSE